MNKKRVIFRADADVNIGYGHFIRTLAIASIINDKYQCCFVTTEPSSYQIIEINKCCEEHLILSKGEENLFLEYLRSDDIVVVDDYDFKVEMQIKIVEKNCKLIYIDDYNTGKYYCHALINNIPGYNRSSFNIQPYTKLYLGSDYAIVRKEFFDKKIKRIKKIKNSIFVSFGGSDPLNITGKLISFLIGKYQSFEINVLIGDGYIFYDQLVSNNYKIKIYRNVDAKTVAEIMAKSEYFIISASSLLNEAACSNGKILIGYYSDNQKIPYDYFVNHNLCIGLGDLRELSLELFMKKFEELLYAKKLSSNLKKIFKSQQQDNIRKIFNDIK